MGRPKKGVVSGASGVTSRSVVADTEVKDSPNAEDYELSHPDTEKDDISGFPGELELNLKRKMKDGATLEEHLSADLGKWLDDEMVAHEKRVEKLAKWDKLYSGVKQTKSYPWPGANNLAIPHTRINIDALVVRIMDVIWGQKKLFICSGKKEPFLKLAPQMEDALDWWQKSIVNLKQKMFPAILQAIKTGAGFVLMDYVKRNRLIYRYASPEERATKASGIFKFKNGQYGIKKSDTTFDGPDVFPISREDVIYSADASNIQDALFCGYRFYLRWPEVKSRVARGKWRVEAADALANEDRLDDTKVSRADTKNIDLRSEGRDKKEFWRLWVKYDVDEDGEEDDVIIIFNRDKKAIMRAVYNPLFAGFRPIIPIVPNPREYSLEGDGACEVMEAVQTEIDTLHNARLDRIDMINAPPTFIRQGSGIENMTYLSPGLVRVVDDDPDRCIQIMKIPEVYPSTVNEEMSLVDTMRQSVGITPTLLGQQTSERPVARDTFQILQESNKKFKFFMDNIRDAVGLVGEYAVEFFAQYKPRYSYYQDDEQGGLAEQTLDFPFEYMRDGLGVELAASSEMMNTEARREINLTLYQLLSDYYTKTAGMVQAIENPQTPPDFKIYLIGAIKTGQTLLEQIVADFGRRDSEALVLDISKVIDLQKAMAPSPPPPPPQMGGPASPQGGGPGPSQQGGPQGPPKPMPQGNRPPAPRPGMGGMPMGPLPPRQPGQ